MKIIWLILLLALPEIVSGREWIIKNHINTKNGLPQNTIRGIRYDNAGYLWIATESGLARWDGKNVKVVTEKESPWLLRSTRIFELNEFVSGNVSISPERYPMVWITVSGSFSFKKESDPGKNLLGWSQYHTVDRRLLLAAPEIQHNQQLINEIQRASGIERIFSQNGKEFVLLTEQKIIWYAAGHATIRSWAKPDNITLFYTGNTLFGIDNRHSVLYRIDKDSLMVPIRQGAFCKLLTGKKKDLQLSCIQGPLLMYDGDRIYQVNCNAGIPTLELLADHLHYRGAIRMIFDSSKHQLTIGTLTDGLYIFHENHFSNILPAQWSNNHSDDVNIIYAIYPYSRDHILTNHGLLPICKNGSVILSNEMGVLALGKWGKSYIFNRGPGVVLADSPFKQYRVLSNPAKLSHHFETLKDSSVLMLEETSLKHETLFPAKTRLVVAHDVGGDLFRCMLKLDDSLALIGSVKNLFICNYRTGTLKPLPQFENVSIRQLYRDRDGTIWIGTLAKGFFRWRGKRIQQFPLDRDSKLDAVNGFINDDQGSLWITTNNGLFRYRVSDLDAYESRKTDKLFYNYFDESNGLPVNEFNCASPCAIVLEDGRFAFSSMKGVVVADHQHIPFRDPSLKVYVDRVTVDTLSIPVENNKQVDIAAGAEQIQFEISSPYTGNPYEIQLFYRLSNDAGNWKALPDDGKILFNMLRKGQYKIEFRLVRSGKDAYESFMFNILPKWYETSTAIVLFFLLLLIVVVIVFRIATQTLRRQKDKLDLLVGERTKGLNSTVDQLNTTITRLRESEEALFINQKHRERFSAMVLHDLQSPLQFLSSITDTMYKTSSAGNDEQVEKMAFELKKSVSHITAFSNDYLNWLKSSFTETDKAVEQTDVAPILNGVCLLLNELARHKGNRISCSYYSAHPLFTIGDYLDIIVRNLVDNANKNTTNGEIEIKYLEEDGMMKIVVSDTGTGIPAAEVERINDFFSGKDDDIHSTRLGLRIVYDLLQKCGGRLFMQSEINRGTTITLSFSKT